MTEVGVIPGSRELSFFDDQCGAYLDGPPEGIWGLHHVEE